MLVGISALTTVGLRRYYAVQVDLPAPGDVCATGTQCAEYTRLLKEAGPRPAPDRVRRCRGLRGASAARGRAGRPSAPRRPRASAPARRSGTPDDRDGALQRRVRRRPASSSPARPRTPSPGWPSSRAARGDPRRSPTATSTPRSAGPIEAGGRRRTAYARRWSGARAGTPTTTRRRATDTRRVLVAHTSPGRSWLLEGTVADPADVLDLDWAALRDGDRDAVRRSLPTLVESDRTHLLVCTNGTRDLCCAAKGRPVALGVAAAAARTGSGRSPTPRGTGSPPPRCCCRPAPCTAGSTSPRPSSCCTPPTAARPSLPGSRGRSTWPAAGQVAELAVREQTGETGPGRPVGRVRGRPPATTPGTSPCAHVDGRRWQVAVTSRGDRHSTGPSRAARRSSPCAGGPPGSESWTRVRRAPARVR